MDNLNTQTVLVVEDDEISRGSLVRAIQDAGFQAVEAADGQQGLDLALSMHPDLIVSDNIMPVKSGVDLLSELRQDSWGKQVPFILLTAEYDLQAVNDSLKAGNTDFLVKDDTTLHSILATVRLRLAA